MSDLSTLLSSLILIIPGYILISVFSYVIGSRLREFVASTIWSILSAAILYSIFDGLSTVFKNFGVSLATLDIASIVKTDLKDGKIAFDNVNVVQILHLSIFASLVGALVGFFIGKFVRSKSFNFLSRRYTGHSYNPDIWNKYFIGGEHPSIYINTKDGKELIANLSYASEIPSNKGIIVYNVSALNLETGDFDDIGMGKQHSMFIPGDNINYMIRYGGEERQSILEEILTLLNQDTVLIFFLTNLISALFAIYYL